MTAVYPRVSECRLCRVVGLNRAAVRRVARASGARPRRVAPELVTRLEVLIHRHPIFGYRRLWALLRFRQGQRITPKTVYRALKLQQGFVHQRPATPRPRVQGRRSRAARSNERWATDVTHVYCGADGWAHLAAVIGCHDRVIVGYEFARRGRAREAERALEEACLARFGTLRPTGVTPVIRSANGLIYQSRRFRAACRDYRLQQEFITPYTPEQNGMTERLFRSLKEECVWQHLFPTLRRRAGRSPRGSAGTTRRARTRRWAIGAHANTGRYKVNWWLDFGEHYRPLYIVEEKVNLPGP